MKIPYVFTGFYNARGDCFQGNIPRAGVSISNPEKSHGICEEIPMGFPDFRHPHGDYAHGIQWRRQYRTLSVRADSESINVLTVCYLL